MSASPTMEVDNTDDNDNNDNHTTDGGGGGGDDEDGNPEQPMTSPERNEAVLETASEEAADVPEAQAAQATDEETPQSSSSSSEVEPPASGETMAVETPPPPPPPKEQEEESEEIEEAPTSEASIAETNAASAAADDAAAERQQSPTVTPEEETKDTLEAPPDNEEPNSSGIESVQQQQHPDQKPAAIEEDPNLEAMEDPKPPASEDNRKPPPQPVMASSEVAASKSNEEEEEEDDDDESALLESLPAAEAAAIAALEEQNEAMLDQRPVVARQESIRDRRNRLEGTPQPTLKKAPESEQYVSLNENAEGSDEASEDDRKMPAKTQESSTMMSEPHFGVADLDHLQEDNRGASLADAARFRGGDWEFQLSQRSNPWSDSSQKSVSDGSMRKRKANVRTSTRSTLALPDDDESSIKSEEPSFRLFGREWIRRTHDDDDDASDATPSYGFFGRRGRRGDIESGGGGLFGFRRGKKGNKRELMEKSPSEEDESETYDDDSSEDGIKSYQKVYMLCDTWFPSLLINIGCVVPSLVILMLLFYNLTGRVWSFSVFAGHLFLTCIAGIASLRFYSHPEVLLNDNMFSTRLRKFLFFLTCLSPIADIILYSCIYPTYCEELVEKLFLESDGTTVPEYDRQVRWLKWTGILGYMIVAARMLVGSLFWMSLAIMKMAPEHSQLHSIPRMGALVWPVDRVMLVRKVAMFYLTCASIVSLVCFGWALYDTVEYFIGWTGTVRQRPGPYCDIMDVSECMLPFPSFHYMLPSKSSPTGYRVNLLPDLLPPVQGRVGKFDLPFLNEMDGFSPAGPILFYLNGMKEICDHAKQHQVDNVTRIMGPSDIELSTTDKSLTLLLDVDAKELVAHSAEMDDFDPRRPMMLISPARPLKHGHHYAVAVFNATNLTSGERLPPSFGMEKLLLYVNSTDIEKNDIERRSRFLKKVIPALHDAAEWISFSRDPMSLQLLFDFPTASRKTQLETIRHVRNSAMREINGKSWKWSEHVRMNDMKDSDCLADGTNIARTIDAELDVPWFLDGFGQDQRGAFLDLDTVGHRKPDSILGSAKFSIQVPCSVWAGIVSQSAIKSKSIKAVMEHGHSLFSDRAEAKEEYVQEMANEGGYIVTAMDWRGMSKYDLPVLFKALVSTPSLFQAVRDNLIQGYACKLAMQHFSRNGLFDTDWLDFETNEGAMVRPKMANPPVYAFWGNSQGGTLGAGYVALSGPTELIDRAVLGVPGTPFALTLARQLELHGMDKVVLLNVQHKRHVQLMLAVLQMSLDCTEGSAFLAEPVTEPYPPILLQSALGDASVPPKATEALARGFQASMLPHRNRDIYGLNQTVYDKEKVSNGQVVFTEFLFRKDHHTLSSMTAERMGLIRAFMNVSEETAWRSNKSSISSVTGTFRIFAKKDCARIMNSLAQVPERSR
eukprot:CAMPEP_0168729682 /NCGR_PEP_ID=MMETSP0724-20121128/6339_1 /TAXON_ID=265536 /ORGANISM="Amphiprora sp., Strain CCMP467" /LENGTH=1410 /DNA_ID=CAMNT_0008776593 /DNA_START=69 /DNA_END=4302 /DNA_ORIENTATION=+